MQAKCAIAALRTAVLEVSRAINSGKNATSFERSISITAIKNRDKNKPSALKLRVSSPDMDITTFVPAEVKESGVRLVPSVLLNAFLSDVEATLQIELESVKGKFDLNVRTSGDKPDSTRLDGMDAADFPAAPELVVGDTAKLMARSFARAVEETAFAANPALVNMPALTAIYVKVSGPDKRLTLAACDSHVMAERQVGLDSEGEFFFEALPPAAKFEQAGRAIRLAVEGALVEYDAPVELGVTDNGAYLVLKYGYTTIAINLLAVKFPNYGPFFPKTWNVQVKLNAKAFSSTMRAVSAYSKEGQNAVRLRLKPGETKLNILAVAAEMGRCEKWVATDSVELKKDLDEARLACNLKMLTEAVSHIYTDYMVIESEGYSKPIILKPMDDEGNILDDQRVLVMAMHFRDEENIAAAA